MGYHLLIEADTASGEPADEEKLDQAGGRLALLGPAFGFSQDTSAVSAFVYVERTDMAQAVAYGYGSVFEAFEAVGEPLTLRSVAAYTEAEFDRVHVRGESA